MKKEIETQLSGLISELEKGIEFSKEQAPIIVQQLLTYELLMASIFLVISIILMGLFVWGLKACSKDDDCGDGMGVLFFGTLFAFMFAVYNSHTIVKIIIAPNLYVLDYLKGLS